MPVLLSFAPAMSPLQIATCMNLAEAFKLRIDSITFETGNPPNTAAEISCARGGGEYPENARDCAGFQYVDAHANGAPRHPTRNRDCAGGVHRADACAHGSARYADAHGRGVR